MPGSCENKHKCYSQMKIHLKTCAVLHDFDAHANYIGYDSQYPGPRGFLSSFFFWTWSKRSKRRIDRSSIEKEKKENLCAQGRFTEGSREIYKKREKELNRRMRARGAMGKGKNLCCFVFSSCRPLCVTIYARFILTYAWVLFLIF